jgi:hypothetical protein
MRPYPNGHASAHWMKFTQKQLGICHGVPKVLFLQVQVLMGQSAFGDKNLMKTLILLISHASNNCKIIKMR